MPRHMQPREVADLKGAIKRNPQRYRKKPPAVDLPLGQAPDHLSEAEKKMWFEIEAYAPKGAWTGADRLTVELLTVLFCEFRQDPKNIRVAKIGQIVSCLGRLGMTPADRQKLGVEEAETKGNAFEAF